MWHFPLHMAGIMTNGIITNKQSQKSLQKRRALAALARHTVCHPVRDENFINMEGCKGTVS